MYDLQFQNMQALDGLGTPAEAYGHLHHNARTHLRRATSMFNHACLLRHVRRL